MIFWINLFEFQGFPFEEGDQKAKFTCDSNLFWDKNQEVRTLKEEFTKSALGRLHIEIILQKIFQFLSDNTLR